LQKAGKAPAPLTEKPLAANFLVFGFTWTADPDKIITAVRRGHQLLNSIH